MFDIEDEYAESDIPTTLIKSKADCPGIEVRHFSWLLVVFCSLLTPSLPRVPKISF